MTTVTTLEGNIALRIHDTANAELTAAQLLLFINMAVQDITNAGWLIYLEEDESLTEAATTFSFAVPATFAYINKILRQNTVTSTYDEALDDNGWRLGLDAGVATLFFNELRYDPFPGGHLKIVGQRRPTVYTAGSDTIDAGLEAVLREGAAFYAFQFVAAGRSEYAGWRQAETSIAYDRFNRLLSYAPQQFRMKPNSRYVPGR